MPCILDTDCIEWTANILTGAMSASVAFSADPENDITCESTGLFEPRNLQVVGCAQVMEAWHAEALAPSIYRAPIASGGIVLTNPTTDRVMAITVQMQFGATRLITTPNGNAAVEDYYQYGFPGSMNPAGFGLVGTSEVNDGNASVGGALTIVDIPGRHIPFVVCPNLGPGDSVEVQMSRTYSVQGGLGSVSAFLLQPSTIAAWGLVL